MSIARIGVIVARPGATLTGNHGPDPVSTERYRNSKRAADPVDRVKNREQWSCGELSQARSRCLNSSK